MGFLARLFGKKPSPKSASNNLRDVAGMMVVNGYRRIAKNHGLAPTAKTSDEKIQDIYELIVDSFRAAAERSGERIPALQLNGIALKFYQVYEELGEEMMHEHLEYEINRYLELGLRPEYTRELPLL